MIINRFAGYYDRYAKRPEQWKSRQATKESAFKDFLDTFGPKETASSKKEMFLTNSYHSSQPEKLKEMRKEIDSHLASAHEMAGKGSKSKLTMSGKSPHSAGDKFLKNKDKRQKRKDTADSGDKKGKKRVKENDLLKSSSKKMKM